MKVQTFNLTIRFEGGHKTYNNISRVAVKRFLEWYQEDEGFYGYDLA